MAMPRAKNKKSLLNKPKGKVVKVSSSSKGIVDLQSMFDDAMFAMGEGFTGPDASASDEGLYHNGRDRAIKYGKLLRQKGVMVKLPR